MADLIGTNVGGPIRPTDSADTYPTAHSDEILGGLHTVDNGVTGIAANRRVEGMLAYDKANEKTYQLVGGIDDNDWEIANLGEIGSLTDKQIVYGDSDGTVDQDQYFTYDDSDRTFTLGATGSTGTITVEGEAKISGDMFVGSTTGSPDSKLHVYGGSAGSVDAISGTQLTVENDEDSYINTLCGDGHNAGILFGDENNADNATIKFASSAEGDGDFTIYFDGASADTSLEMDQSSIAMKYDSSIMFEAENNDISMPQGYLTVGDSGLTGIVTLKSAINGQSTIQYDSPQYNSHIIFKDYQGEGSEAGIYIDGHDNVYIESNSYIKLDSDVIQIYGNSVLDSSNNHYTKSSGNTGGSSSAGSGNQYVELNVNGTIYKVLHDGTV